MKRILILALLGLMISCVYSQPFVEIEKIVAADRGGINDYFGIGVDMDGDRAIVGALYEDEDANGANTRLGAGAAYIFEKDSNNNWMQAQKLVANDRDVDDLFGQSVAISGNYAIVGASREDHNENGMGTINGAGSAYIFERDGNGIWNQAAKIVAPDRDAGDNFGLAVSISGDYAIVGVYLEKEDTAGNNSLVRAGAAYIFERAGNGSWPFVQKLVPADRAFNDWFGYSVSISGSSALIGAPFEDEDATGGNTLGSAGSAYLFERNGSGVWAEAQKIVAADRGGIDRFGTNVSIDGTYLVVGASGEDEDENGANTVLSAGSAYVFEKNGGGSWVQANKIVASDRESSDLFGAVVSINGNFVVVGAYQEKEDTAGGNTLNNAGSAYMYQRDGGGNWNEVQKVVASDREAEDLFGYAVANSGSYALIGAYREKEDPNGNNTVVGAGSCYIFQACPATYSTQSITACDNYIWPVNGNTYTSTGSYTTTRMNSAGCDSVITLNLTIRSSNTGNESITTCDSYIWPANGATYSNSGTFTTTLLNAAGCDSVITLNLTLNTSNSSAVSMTACDNYLWPTTGLTYSVSGNYATTLTNVAGCDSVVTLNLTIHNSNTGTETVTTCNSYTWPANGTTYSNSGSYTTSLSNAVGCDSVVTLNLTVNTSSSSSVSMTACDSYIWPSTGLTYSASGSYATTLTNVAGCDSVVTLNLTILNSNTGTETVTTCNSYTWPVTGITYSGSGSYTTTLSNAAGCDSVVTLNLTVNTSSSSSVSMTACDSYIWPSTGLTYSASGSYATTLTNSAGCDSVVTLSLTIQNSTTGTETVTACNSYTWPVNGTTYSGSGSYTATLTNSLGCDSVITLNLTLTTSTFSSFSMTACDNYLWPTTGLTYSASGTFPTTLTNAAGCDSIVTLNLTINSSNTGTESVTTCNSYTWPANSATYTNSGSYTAILTNAAGCDSIVTLNLTINSSNTGSESVTTCNSYTWPANNVTYTNSGTYTAILTNASGCDSVATLNLTLQTVTTSVTQVGATLTADAVSADYQWLTCPNMAAIQGETSATFIATSNGDYAVEITENGCTDTSTCYSVNTVSRIEEVEEMSWEVYPNPTSGILKIDLGLVQAEITLSVYDLQGRKLDTVRIRNQQIYELELDGPAGIYLLELIGEARIGHFRVVKQ